MQPSNLSVQLILMFRIWRLREYKVYDQVIRVMKATAPAASNTSTVFVADRSSFVLISTHNWFQPITSHLSDHNPTGQYYILGELRKSLCSKNRFWH